MSRERSSFLIKVLESFIGKSGVTLFSMVTTFFIAKFYGANQLGDYTYILSIITVLATFAKVGMDNGLIYVIPKVGNKLISFALLVNFLTSAVFILIFITTTNLTNIKVISLLIWMFSLESIMFGILRAKGRIKEYYSVRVILNSIMKLFFVLVMYFYRGAAFSNLVISTLIPFILTNLILLYRVKKSIKKIEVDRKFLYYSFSMVFISVLGILMTQIDLLMIPKFLEVKELGVYKVVTQLSSMISFILVTFGSVFAPKAAELYHNNNKEALSRLYIQTTRVIFVCSLGVAFLLYISSYLILGFYGIEFLAGRQALVIRMIGQLINSSVGCIGLLIVMTGNQRVQITLNLLACVSNIVLNYILIPKFGISGAAIASVISMLIINYIGYSFISKKMNIKVYKLI